MAVTGAPKRKQDTSAVAQASSKTEREIKAVINRGGSTSIDNDQSAKAVKMVNVSLTMPEHEIIAELRERRPRDARSKRKTPISLHAWLVEAAQEKIEREKKKYGIV